MAIRYSKATGGDLAERAVAPAVVVDGVDPGGNGTDRLGSGRELMPVVELGFQG